MTVEGDSDDEEYEAPGTAENRACQQYISRYSFLRHSFTYRVN